MMEAGVAEIDGHCHRVSQIEGQPKLRRRDVSFFSKATGVEELLEILKMKYGTLTRAWRVALDADDSGLLDFREFSSALAAIGYVGNMRTLWFNLDDDNSGTISLNEIDPAAYVALEKFRVLAGRQCGGMINCWNQVLDKAKSGTVGLVEFSTGLQELGYTDEAEAMELFEYLITTPGKRYITQHDIVFLQTWEEQKQEAARRKRLPRAWVNRDPYLSPPKAGSIASGMMTTNPSMSTLHSLPSLQGGLTTATEEMSIDWGSVIAFDEEKQKEAFLSFLVSKFGSLSKAFDAIDANGSGSLSLVEFQAQISSVLRYCRPSEATRLFLSFQNDPLGKMTWSQLGVSRAEWVNHILQRVSENNKRRAQRPVGSHVTGLGRSPRQLKSYEVHSARLRNEKKQRDVAFGMPLPKEWGYPPYFDPLVEGRMKLPPLSARATYNAQEWPRVH